MTYSKIFDYTIEEPDEYYHHQSQTGKTMSSHKLADFMYDPVKYKMSIDGLIPHADSNNYKVGRAAHCWILEGEVEFEKHYHAGGLVNPKTGKSYGSSSKKQLAYEQEIGLSVITDDEMDMITSMTKSVRNHKLAYEFLSEGKPERVMRATINGVECQIKSDWLSGADGLGDLKTCQDLEKFEYDAKRYDYARQMAFYRMVIKEVTGLELPCYLIAVEKELPFKVGMFRLDPELLMVKERIIRATLTRYKLCKDSNEFKSNYESMRTITD